MQLAELETVPGEDGGSEVVAVEVDNPPREQQLRAESPQNDDAEAHEDDDDDVMVDVEATIARYFQDSSACPIEVEEHNDYQVDLGDMHSQLSSGNTPNSGVHVNSINAVKSDVTIGTKVIIKGRTTVIVNKSEKSNGALPAPVSAPAEKTDGAAEQPVDGHKLSSCSSHPFIPFSRGKAAEWFRSRLCVIGIFFVVLLIISLAAVLYVIFNPGTEYTDFVPRSGWNARPPDEPPTKLRALPPSYVIIGHTVTPSCVTRDECIDRVSNIQGYFINNKGFTDIGYNFLVGGDGAIYEGQGWDIEGAHTQGWNRRSMGFGFIGNYIYDTPSKKQIEVTQSFLEQGVREGKLAPDYVLLGQNQVQTTDSPGRRLSSEIQKWKHWAPKP